jgi:aryl-alcohol dehydrogenase-like predicted oxidoreductase
METSRIGETDLCVSRVGFGACAAGGVDYGKVSDDDSIAAIRFALEQGVNFFDTADVYGFGHSEEVLAKALGAERNEVVVATKFGVAWDATGRTYRDTSTRYVVAALEASLRRLRLDCIPLYQIHWHDGVTALEDTLDALERCRTAGKIRFYGCSNFSGSMLERAVRAEHMVTLQLPYSLSEIEHAAAADEGVRRFRIGLVAYNVLARGLLTGKYKEISAFQGSDTRQRDRNFQGGRFNRLLALVDLLEQVSARYEKSPGQVAIRWVLDNPNVACALVGVKRVAQIRENLGALDWKLDSDDYTRLSLMAASIAAADHDQESLETTF